MATSIKVRSSSARGQAVVEMALTLPLLLLVVFGIFDFGFMFQRYEVVTNAAREGARIGVLSGSAGYTATEAQNRALDYMARAGINATVAGTCGGALVKNQMCAVMSESAVTVAGSTPAKTVQQVTMIVEYDHEHSFVGPIIRLFGSPELGIIRLRAASSMRKE